MSQKKSSKNQKWMVFNINLRGNRSRREKIFNYSKIILLGKEILAAYSQYRSSHSELFLGKGVLKICSKFTGEHPCWSAILIKLLCSFIKITLRDGCSPVNLLHIFRTPFPRNISEWRLLSILSPASRT